MIARRSAVLGAALFALAGAPALAVDLAPHRAAYSLKLEGAGQAGNILSARGAMVSEWGESCDAWTTEQRIVLELVNTQDDVLATDTGFTSWESKDGLRYRFSLRTLRNEEVSEEYRGDARLPAAGKAGEARYTLPAGQVVKLPAGTIFPMVHSRELAKAAAASRGRFAATVFDGATKEGMSQVNAVIGKAVAADDKDRKSPLTDRRSWNVRLAFFDPGAKSPAPQYELGLRMFANGVAGDQIMDFGEFRVRATLEHLEPLAKPKC